MPHRGPLSWSGGRAGLTRHRGARDPRLVLRWVLVGGRGGCGPGRPLGGPGDGDSEVALMCARVSAWQLRPNSRSVGPARPGGLDPERAPAAWGSPTCCCAGAGTGSAGRARNGRWSGSSLSGARPPQPAGPVGVPTDRRRRTDGHGSGCGCSGGAGSRDCLNIVITCATMLVIGLPAARSTAGRGRPGSSASDPTPRCLTPSVPAVQRCVVPDRVSP